MNNSKYPILKNYLEFFLKMSFPVLQSSRVHPIQSKGGCVCQRLATSGKGWCGVTGPLTAFTLSFQNRKTA